MKDIFLMNRETGELIPSEQVFRDFYQTHGIKESVFDEWAETDIEADNDIKSPLECFRASVRI